jgi:hypothetical protein
MANFKSPHVTREKATAYHGGGELFVIPAQLDLSAAAINDVLEFVDLQPGVVVEDFIVHNTATALAFTLGELNGTQTAVAATWKAGVAAFQRADNGIHRGNATVNRRLGALVTTAATGAGVVNVSLFCRAL